MNINIYFSFILVTSLLSFSGCTEEKKPAQKKILLTTQLKETLVDVNKDLAKSEDDEINAFVERYNWDMIKTATGLRYLIYKKGQGPSPHKGNIVKLNYKLKLINGNEVYNSEKDGPKMFEMGKAQVETGLEEAMHYMNKGSKAKVIIPSHLGFGLVGDRKKIPLKATLIYDVEVVDIK
ncbi:MAG: FKBP-type peptidyl-prolyl cis-trans isomerase [Bacteroidota bacterium]|nr:FKBP-type peptidyl-prolyl cis-trans isomerase [Bacteroidota bacterium]